MKRRSLSLIFCTCTTLLYAQDAPLSDLTQTNLSNKKIITLPANVVKDVSIQHINFSNNPYFDLADSIRMPGVISLDLSHTIVNPWELDKIGRAFPNLERLDLSGTQLSFIGSRLQTFGKLKQLDLSDNAMQLIPYEIQQLTNLEVLDISNNEIISGVGNLGYLWNLKSLDADHNSALDPNALLSAISMNDNLKHLSLSAEELSDDAATLLASTNITELELDHVASPFPTEFGAATKITSLSISQSAIPSTGTASLSKLTQLKNLTVINSNIPPNTAVLKRLDKLIVEQNSETWTNNINLVKTLGNLKVLDISKTDFKPEDLLMLKAALPNTEIVTGTAESSKEMQANAVAPIIEAPITLQRISSTEPVIVNVKGTTFDIPANAFLTADNRIYNGPVDVKVKVYDNAFTMALEGTPMTFSENGQDELFSSNGMIDFRATTPDGQELSPNPGNLIQVSMKNLQPGTETGLFQLNDSTRQWTQLPQQPQNRGIDPRLLRAMDSIKKIDYRNNVNYQPVEAQYELKTKHKRYDPTTLQLLVNSRKVVVPDSNEIQGYYQVEQEMREFLDLRTFQIDSVISKDLADQLKNIHYRKKEGKTTALDYYYAPRLIWHVRLTPDYAHDNYRLTFFMKDSACSLPVVVPGQNPRNTQRTTEKFEKKRFKAQKEMDERMFLIEKEKDSMINILAEQYKARMLMLIQQAMTGGDPLAMDRYQFGLGQFGTVNCDYFQRNRPSRYINVASQLTDQDNNVYDSINDVRVVMPSDFTYLAVAPEKVPVYNERKNYGLIRLGENLLGVIVLIGSSSDTIKKVRTINIEGKDPNEIRNLIEQE